MSEKTGVVTENSVRPKVWGKAAPTEQGWYWHWNGDPGCSPVPMSVLWSGTTKRCFVSAGQLGINRAIDCAEYGGYWMPMQEPGTDVGGQANCATARTDDLLAICAAFGWRTDGDAATLANRITHHIRDLKASVRAHEVLKEEAEAEAASPAASKADDPVNEVLKICRQYLDEGPDKWSARLCFTRIFALAAKLTAPQDPPFRDGKNQYGLDVGYFSRWLGRVVPTLDVYRPDEIARVFGRMAAAADRDALMEELFVMPAVVAQDAWYAAGEMPAVRLGGELQCFVALRNRQDGKVRVIDAYYVNKPLIEDPSGNYPDWTLTDDSAGVIGMVGWAEQTHHPDYCGYFEQLSLENREVIGWQPVIYPTAPVFEVMAGAKPLPVSPSDWRFAILDELVNCHIYRAEHKSDPVKSLRDVISWHVSVALDPRVSSDAQVLVTAGASAERVACEQIAAKYLKPEGGAANLIMAEIQARAAAADAGVAGSDGSAEDEWIPPTGVNLSPEGVA